MGTENTFGRMGVFIREILSTGLGTDTEFGQIKTKCKYFLGAIEWIKSKGSESMSG